MKNFKPEDRQYDELTQDFPEHSMYDEDFRINLCRENADPYAELYEVIFEVSENKERFYCFIDGCDSLLEALGLFFQDHPNVTYNMIYETLRC